MNTDERYNHFIQRVKERYKRTITLKECKMMESDIIKAGQGETDTEFKKPIFLNHRFRTETWYINGLFVLFRDNEIRTVIDSHPVLYKKVKKIKRGEIKSRPEARNIDEKDEFNMFSLLLKEKYKIDVSREVWEKWCGYIDEASKKTMKYYTNPHCVRLNRTTKYKNVIAYRINEDGMPPIILGLYTGKFHPGAIIPLSDPMNKNNINVQNDLLVKRNEIIAKHAGQF